MQLDRDEIVDLIEKKRIFQKPQVKIYFFCINLIDCLSNGILLDDLVNDFKSSKNLFLLHMNTSIWKKI